MSPLTAAAEELDPALAAVADALADAAADAAACELLLEPEEPHAVSPATATDITIAANTEPRPVRIPGLPPLIVSPKDIPAP